MTWQEKIIAAHTAVTDSVSHYYKLKSERYFVWQEEAGADLVAEGVHAERAVRGTTDLYTKTEDDPWRAAFEAALDAAGIAWYWNSTSYEEATGYIHTEWVWEVVNGEEADDDGQL